MRLELNLGTDVNYTDFVNNYLMTNLYNYIRLNLSETKSKIFENYLRNNYNIKFSLRQILDLAFRYMNFENSRGTYKFYVNNSVVVPGTIFKLESVLELIEYGNLEIRGLGVFTKGRDYIIKNLVDLYGQYERVGNL